MRLKPRVKFAPKIKIPEDFRMIVDTREQKSIFEPEHWIINKALPVGDFSINGFETLITIERKSTDLYSSLGVDRERFTKELEKMKDYKWKGLLIQATEPEIYEEHEFSGLHANSVYHSLAAIETKYGLHIYYAMNIDLAKWWVLSRLTKLYKYLREGLLI